MSGNIRRVLIVVCCCSLFVARLGNVLFNCRGLLCVACLLFFDVC